MLVSQVAVGLVCPERGRFNIHPAAARSVVGTARVVSTRVKVVLPLLG